MNATPTLRFRQFSLGLILCILPVATAAAQDKCEPPRLLADAAIYGGATTAIEPSLPALQTEFDTAFREICEQSGGMLELQGATPVTEINLFNAQEANQMSIYESDTLGALVIEYPFEIDGALSDLPDAAEFQRAIICTLGKAEEFKLDETACLPD